MTYVRLILMAHSVGLFSFTKPFIGFRRSKQENVLVPYYLQIYLIILLPNLNGFAGL